jgi:hypothetical protein
MLPKNFNSKIPRPSKSRESQYSVLIGYPLLTPGSVLGQMNRSGFKTSDQVQGQGAGRSGKRSPPEADEHLPEAVLHLTLLNQMRIPHRGAIRQRRTIGPQMGL